MKYTHREAGTTDAFFFTSAPFEGFVFLCICRSDIWVPRSLSMYMRMDDDTHSSRLGAQGPFRSFPSLSLVTSSSSAHARARTNERTNARGYFFFSSISSCRRSPVRVASSVSTASAIRARAFAHSRIRAGMRFGCSGTRANATRETRRRARGMCGMFFWGVARANVVVASSSTRANARTTTGRRPDDDDSSTGWNVAGVNLRLFAHMDLSLGCGRSRERERERDEMTSD